MTTFDPVEWITTQEAAELTGYAMVTLRLLALEALAALRVEAGRTGETNSALLGLAGR